MSRPLKLRKVCMLPKSSVFSPVGQKRKKNPIFLTIDEYEVIRLLDKEGFSQEQCGEYMDIARTTVQQIYASARKKIAEALVEGFPIRIEGGNYLLCDSKEKTCGCNGCKKQKNIKNEKAKKFL